MLPAPNPAAGRAEKTKAQRRMQSHEELCKLNPAMAGKMSRQLDQGMKVIMVAASFKNLGLVFRGAK